MMPLVGTASFFKKPIHLKTLGFHATEYGEVFLTTRNAWAESDVYVDPGLCLCLRTNQTHLPLKTGSLGNLYMQMPGVNDRF